MVDLPSFAIGLAAGLGLAAIFVWTRRPRGASLEQPPEMPRPAVRLDAALERDVHDLVSRGRLIEAIKLVRQETRCDLKTAKERVEAIQRGG